MPALSLAFTAQLARGGEVDGVKIFGPREFERCLHRAILWVPTTCCRFTTRFGLGFMLSLPGIRCGPNLTASAIPAPAVRSASPIPTPVGFGYVMNQMGNEPLMDVRPGALIEAVYASL